MQGPTISADGTFVSCTSFESARTGGASETTQVLEPELSADAKALAFESSAELAPGEDGSGTASVYVVPLED